MTDNDPHEVTEREFLDSFDDQHKAWDVAFEIAERLKELGIFGRMVTVRRANRRFWYVEMVYRVRLPEPREPAE